MLNVPFHHPAWIEVDLRQFKKNLALIQDHIGHSKKICLVVKANAYGHGLVPVAKAALAAKVDYLAVSCLQEGILLRHANINIPVLVLGAIHVEQIPELIKYDLEFTVASHYKAKLVSEVCAQLKKTAKVHLEVDTGMNRTGVRLETAPAVLKFIQANSYFQLIGVYSHLAIADMPGHDFTSNQIKKFTHFIEMYGLNKTVICHLANSAGVTFFSASHLDMVRPGLLAFGYYPSRDMPKKLLDIKPCFSIRAKVSYFKTVLQGAGISYNHTYIAPKDTHILTIPIGYGDGLRRNLSNKAAVLLNGKRYPIVGAICMDQCMVDIGSDSGYVGDVVTIIGTDKNSAIKIEEHSDLCATNVYEILCGFNNRLPRAYHTEAGIVWWQAENCHEL